MQIADYLVRQLNDHKAAIDLEALKGPGLAAYAEVCGELLARGHARSGDVHRIVGYIGNGDSFAEALVNFAVAYADQTEADWEELRKSKHAPRSAARTKAAAAKKVSRAALSNLLFAKEVWLLRRGGAK